MQIGKRKHIASLVIAFLAGVVLAAGIFTIVFFVKNSGDDAELAEKYEKLEELYQAVTDNFYTEVDEDKLMDGACRGLVDALEDPYSSYMTTEEYQSWMESVTGEYSGIGITFTEDTEGNFVIVSVNKDAPAEKAGLQAGDLILQADDKIYDNMELLSNAIKGEAGTDVKLTYSRDGQENSVVITREDIVQHSVSHEMLDGETGYIELSSFIESTAEDFEKAMEDIEEQGAKKLVLDLRDNGGGLVDQCVQVADAFLDKGTIVIVEGKDGKQETYEAEDGKTDMEVVALVNENSASAAEILAAALQDYGIEVVGQKTFGKGVIQSTGMMEDGSALKLTIMQYFSPDGNPINEKGVAPDHKVEAPEDGITDENDPQLEKALELL